MFQNVLCDFTNWTILRKDEWETNSSSYLYSYGSECADYGPEMANGGRPKPMFDRLHQMLPAGVNSPKEGLLHSLPNHGNNDHKSSTNDKCAERHVTAMTLSYRLAPTPKDRVVA